MKLNEALDELGYLTTQANSLSDSIELAREVSPDMLPELKRLQSQVLNRIQYIARYLLGPSGFSMEGKQKHPKVTLETLERMFLKFRADTESAYAKLSRASASEEKRLSKVALVLSRLTQQTARSLKVVAEARGLWNEEYMNEHGLGSWIPEISEEE